MGDPLGALRHARDALKGYGTLLLVKPAAGEKRLAELAREAGLRGAVRGGGPLALGFPEDLRPLRSRR